MSVESSVETNKRATKWPDKIVDFTTLLSRHVAELCLFSLIGLITVDVVGRYLLSKPTRVADEISGYLLVAITFLGAAYTLQRGMHIQITLLLDRLPARVKWLLSLLMEAACLIFIVVIFWQSAKLVQLNIEDGTRSSSAMRTPMYIPELLVPIGLAIFGLETLRELITAARKGEGK